MGKKSIDINYVNFQTDNFLHYLYSNIDNEVSYFIEQVAQVAEIFVFSGIIRNYFINPKRGIRDLDLVFKAKDLQSIRDIVTLFDFSINSFGGYKIKIGELNIDFWDIDNTWGLNYRNYHIDLQKEYFLPKSSFFNFSSVVFDLKNKRFIASDSFVEFLKKREIDLVLEDNPYPLLCIVNTIYYSNTYHLKISKKLKSYYTHNFKNYDSLDFDKVQLKHFKKILYSYGELNTYYKIFLQTY